MVYYKSHKSLSWEFKWRKSLYKGPTLFSWQLNVNDTKTQTWLIMLCVYDCNYVMWSGGKNGGNNAACGKWVFCGPGPSGHIPHPMFPAQLSPRVCVWCAGALSSHQATISVSSCNKQITTLSYYQPIVASHGLLYSWTKHDHDVEIKLEYLFYWGWKYIWFRTTFYPQAGDSLIVSIIPVPFLRRLFEASLFFKTSYSRFTLIMATWFL